MPVVPAVRCPCASPSLPEPPQRSRCGQRWPAQLAAGPPYRTAIKKCEDTLALPPMGRFPAARRPATPRAGSPRLFATPPPAKREHGCDRRWVDSPTTAGGYGQSRAARIQARLQCPRTWRTNDAPRGAQRWRNNGAYLVCPAANSELFLVSATRSADCWPDGFCRFDLRRKLASETLGFGNLARRHRFTNAVTYLTSG